MIFLIYKKIIYIDTLFFERDKGKKKNRNGLGNVSNFSSIDSRFNTQ